MSAEVILYEQAAASLAEQFKRGSLSQLQPHPNWIVWRREEDRKVPYSPTRISSRASSSNPSTWGSLQATLAALASGRYDGLGFMLHPERLPLTFIDLDHCFDEASGKITDPLAQEIIRQLNSYTEVSPSGTGLHVLAFGTLPGSGVHAGIEMYHRGRYATITTRSVPGTPAAIEHRQAEITALYAAYKPRAASNEHNSGVLMERSGTPLLGLPSEAERDPLLQQLLRGEIFRFGGDESRADYVLLMKLLHWTGDDVALTKQLFLDSPLGSRKKAQEKRGPTTYLDMTIRNVLRKRRNPPMKR